MKGEDFEEFLRLMWEVSELYDKGKPTAGALKLYFVALAPLSLEEVAEALSYHVRISKFFPRPAEILAHSRGSVEDRARSAWRAVVSALGRIGSWSSVRFEDPAIHYALEQMGGWESLGNMETKDLPFREKDFIHWYSCADRSHIGADDVPWSLMGRVERQNLHGGHELPPVISAETGEEIVRTGGAGKARALPENPTVQALTSNVLQAVTM